MLFVAAWSFAVSSPQYKLAKSFLDSGQVVSETGKIKLYVLTGFDISDLEGTHSTVSFYVFGERKSGYMRLALVNGLHGPVIVSARFGATMLLTPAVTAGSRT